MLNTGALLSLCGALLMILGVVDILSNYESNSCSMTYMYEWPHYDPIFISKSSSTRFPSYKLYIYFEGYHSPLNSENLNGIPVLFIPGNAGSHKQVRSAGSVALRRGEYVRSSFHFDFFSVDFNEELSGLYGGIVRRQTEYVSLCIKKILSLYKDSETSPKSVILIGHSMGGMIARALFTLPTFDPSTVSVILTQSTPHQSPVIALDSYLAEFYESTNSYWMNHHHSNLSHINLVSTGGGYRDILVRQGLTNLIYTLPDTKAISTCTMTVPKCWVSTDHLCAVWCKQMVLVTVRSLFDIIDKQTRQVHTDVYHRQVVFNHHFVSHNGYDQHTEFAPNLALRSDLDSEIVDSHINMDNQQADVRLIYIPFNNNSVKFVAVTDTMQTSWIGVCTRGHCSSVENLSALSSIISSPSGHKKVLHLDTNDVIGDTIVLHLIRSKQKEYVSAEIYNPDEHHLTYTLPTLLDILLNYPRIVMTPTTILTVPVSSHGLFYNISIIGLESVLQAYSIMMETSNCSDDTDIYEVSTLTMWLPWAHEHTNLSLKKSEMIGYLDMKLQTPRPRHVVSPVQLHFYPQPHCQYVLSLKIDFVQLLGQFVRFYGVMLPAFIIAPILISRLHFTSAPHLLESVFNYKAAAIVLVATTIATYLLRFPRVSTYTDILGLPSDDALHLEKTQLWFTLFYPTMFLAGAVIFSIHSIAIHVTLRVIGSGLRFIFNRCHLANAVKQALHIIIVIMALLSVGVSVKFCGVLGVAICYVIKLIVTVVSYSKDTDNSTKQRHLMNMLLWMWLCLLNASPAIHWAKNLKYSWLLPGDQMQVSGPILCIAFLISTILSQSFSFTKRLSLLHDIVNISAAILLLLYGCVSVYRITYILSALALLKSLLVSVSIFTLKETYPIKEKPM